MQPIRQLIIPNIHNVDILNDSIIRDVKTIDFEFQLDEISFIHLFLWLNGGWENYFKNSSLNFIPLGMMPWDIINNHLKGKINDGIENEIFDFKNGENKITFDLENLLVILTCEIKMIDKYNN